MDDRANPDLTFQAAARRVVGRLFLARWFRLLGRSAVVIYPAAAVLAVCTWYYGLAWVNAFGVIALLPGWLALTAVLAWLGRPSGEAALARWDEIANRKEMFISAYCFEARGRMDAGEQLHFGRATRRLQEDVAALPRDLPIALAHRAWALPVVFLALVAFLLIPPPLPAEARMDDDSRKQAQKVAQQLAGKIKLADKSEGLTEDEKKELKKLEQSLEETAKKLGKLDQQTHRSVLAELEEKAHEAEKLAEALDSAAEEEFSSKMLEELARHADTTDFASAMQAKDLQKGSDEAMKLSKRLDHEDLSLEERKRIEHALGESLDAATKDDKQGLVGKHLKQAHQELEKNKPKPAAKQLQKLSKQLAQAKQRQLAKKRLQQLAQQLRNSGQKIFGRKTSQIQRLTRNNQAGLKQLGAKQLKALGNIPLRQQLGAMPQGPLGRQTPGLQLAPGQNPPNAPNGAIAMGQTPIPGSQPTAMPGTGQLPIPGMGQCPSCGGQCQGQCQGQGAGTSPVPGTAMGQGAGKGGLYAGHGTAPYGNNKTNPLTPSGTGVVNAAVSGDGPSQVRNVEQGMHREETSRETQQLLIEFIKTEEAALADEPLPLSRREQARRYLTALSELRRQAVEHEPPE